MKLHLLLPFLFTLPALAGEADEARKLAGDFNRAKLAYVQKLDGLLAKAKASGDTAAVKTIEGLIAEAEGKKAAGEESATQDPLKPLLGTWQHEDSSIWKFTSTKGGVARGRYDFTMSHDSEKKRAVLIGGNWVNYLTFTSNPDVVNGSYEENGRTKRFKLTRVK
jgi:hypothetical protein